MCVCVCVGQVDDSDPAVAMALCDDVECVNNKSNVVYNNTLHWKQSANIMASEVFFLFSFFVF